MKSEWREIKERYGNQCLMCGQKAKNPARPSDPGVLLTKDHVVPRSQGGDHGAANIQPLCSPCNSRKGNLVIDFRVSPPLWKSPRTGKWEIWKGRLGDAAISADGE